MLWKAGDGKAKCPAVADGFHTSAGSGEYLLEFQAVNTTGNATGSPSPIAVIKPPPQNRTSLAPGAIAGVVIAVLVACLLAFGVFILYRRKRIPRGQSDIQQKSSMEGKASQGSEKVSSSNFAQHIGPGTGINGSQPAELVGDERHGQRHELP